MSDRPGPAGASAPPPLSVLHVLEAVRGGTSRHVLDIVRNATSVHHTVAVSRPGGDAGSGAAYDHGAVEQMERAGARIVEIPMHRTPWHPANARAARTLRRMIVTDHPDAVHGHSSVGGALARLAGLGTPVPVLYTPNGLAQGRPFVAVERFLGRFTDGWIAVSASEAERALELGLTRPERLAVIPNGIDLGAGPPDGLPPKDGRPANLLSEDGKPADLRERLGIGPAVPLVGTVARLVEQKAPERFVRVAGTVGALRPDAHFLLIGMGPLQDRVDAEVARAGLGDRWHQIPHLDRAAAVLDQLDAFVLASEFEGAPYTPLEAMRAGVPVVLSDVVGNRDAVEDGVSGVLRDRHDTAGMAQAVVRILTDADHAKELAAQATVRLAAHFDAAVMGRELEVLYAGLAAGGRTRRSTRRLPQPIAASSAHSPDSIAAQ